LLTPPLSAYRVSGAAEGGDCLVIDGLIRPENLIEHVFDGRLIDD